MTEHSRGGGSITRGLSMQRASSQSVMVFAFEQRRCDADKQERRNWPQNEAATALIRTLSDPRLAAFKN